MGGLHTENEVILNNVSADFKQTVIQYVAVDFNFNCGYSLTTIMLPVLHNTRSRFYC